jgi:hypothetical protein
MNISLTLFDTSSNSFQFWLSTYKYAVSEGHAGVHGGPGGGPHHRLLVLRVGPTRRVQESTLRAVRLRPTLQACQVSPEQRRLLETAFTI